FGFSPISLRASPIAASPSASSFSTTQRWSPVSAKLAGVSGTERACSAQAGAAARTNTTANARRIIGEAPVATSQRYQASADRAERVLPQSAEGLAIRRVEFEVLGDLALPAVAVREQALLVIVELLARLGGELEVRPLDDRIHRAGLLAEAAVDALHHVDVIAGCAPRAVVTPGSRFDGDRLRWANRLAKLAGDAVLLPIRIATQRMLAPEAGR